MAADIFIKSAGLSPNPVIAGAAVTISVEIGDRVSALADHDGSLITDTDGMGLWIPEERWYWQIMTAYSWWTKGKN